MILFAVQKYEKRKNEIILSIKTMMVNLNSVHLLLKVYT